MTIVMHIDNATTEQIETMNEWIKQNIPQRDCIFSEISGSQGTVLRRNSYCFAKPEDATLFKLRFSI